MKKILTFICVFALFLSGCSKQSPKVVSDVSEKDIIEAISGEYLNADDSEDFKKTKSTVSSLSALRMMRITKSGIDIGDAHQGVSLGEVKNAVQSENGSYTFESFENENNNLKGEFFPESGTLKCTLKTDYSKRGETVNQYIRFNSYEEIASYLSGILFSGVKGISEENGKYFAQSDGKKIYLEVSPDTSEPMIPQGYLGSIFITEDGKEGRKACFYKYESEKLLLFDEEGGLVAQF